jgi:hypothetical protein
MRHKWIFIPVLLVAVGAGLLSGCARKSDEAAMTTVDSTLASGDVTSDAPEPGPTAGEYTAPPPATRTGGGTRRGGGGSSGGSSSGGSSGGSTKSSTATYTVPAGTAVTLALSQELSTKSAASGQEFTATVANPVVVDGVVVIPEGAEVTGHVEVAQRSGKSSGRAYMQLGYDQISFGGKTYNIASVGDTVWGKGGSKKDAAMIGGGAVAGAILGKVLGGSGGDAAKGAVIGGAAGTAASLMTRGPDLKIEEGQTIVLSLDRPITVTKPRTGA